jgi:hypothetical protein
MFGEVRHIRHIVKAGNAGISESSLMTLLESFPSGDLCFELLSAYFRLLQPIYRIIHVPSFWADYEQFCQEPQRMETLFVMQLALLYAIGTSFYAGPDKIEVQERARTWIDLVQSWIVGPAAKTTHNLAGLQVYCLLILSKQMVYNAGGLTWISSGSLLTMAMSMGLHQDPLLFPSLTPFQVEMRRRLWAATLELYVQHHVDSSIALTLRPSDIEMPEFLNLDDKDLGKDATTTPKSKEGITDASIQIQLTESLALRLEVAHMVNALHQECSFDTALELAEQFKAACRKLSDLFRLMDSRGGDDGDSAPRHFQRKFLDAMLRKYIILIHRPFMIMSRSSPALYLSRKTCVDAAKIIVSHLDGKPGTEELMRLAAAGRGSFKGPLSQNIVMVLSLELFMLLQEDDGVRQVGAADPMDIVQQEARDAVYRPLERICKQAPEVMRAGSVCTGTYNFVAAMLAQARATEAGQCTKMAVNGSIRESLKVTLAILHTNYPLLVKRSLANTGHAEKEKPFLALDSSYVR